MNQIPIHEHPSAKRKNYTGFVNILLKVISTYTPAESAPTWISKKEMRFQSIKARFDRLWHLTPSLFETKSVLQNERIKRIWSLLDPHESEMSLTAIDIGCGEGRLLRLLGQNCKKVDALDVSSLPLNNLRFDVEKIQEAYPFTSLKDNYYDIVLIADLIAEIESQYYRLFFSEASRILKDSGIFVCSTPIAINTVGGAEKFLSLAKTEFEIIELSLSYNAFWIRLKNFISLPGKLALACSDSDSRYMEKMKLTGIKRKVFMCLTVSSLRFLWQGVSSITQPIQEKLLESSRCLLFLEKLCKKIQGNNGISHVILRGKKKRLEIVSRHGHHP